MRDPARISVVLRLIERAWKQNPDMRLGQLIDSLATPNHPIFYVEDEDLVQNAHLVVSKGWPSLYPDQGVTE